MRRAAEAYPLWLIEKGAEHAGGLCSPGVAATYPTARLQLCGAVVEACQALGGAHGGDGAGTLLHAASRSACVSAGCSAS